MTRRVSPLLPVLTLLTVCAAALSAQTPVMPVIAEGRQVAPFMAELHKSVIQNLLTQYEASTDLGPAPTEVRVFRKRWEPVGTVTMPAGRIVRDFELGDFDADGTIDLVVMTTDALGAGSGSLLFYMHLEQSLQVDHTVNSLGPGFHSFAAGSLDTVKPFVGGAARILVADPGYTVGGLAQAGMMVCLDLYTGQPVISWGWQGNTAQAQFGAATAGRDAVPGIGGAVIITEPGYPGPQGNQGRVYAADPVLGTLWWSLVGMPGMRLGREAAFNGHFAVVSNPDADHVALNQTDNGAVLEIDLRTPFSPIQHWGAASERLGVDLAAFGDLQVAIAGERGLSLVTLGTGTRDLVWTPPNPGATCEERRALVVRDVPNFDDPVITVQTRAPTGPTASEFRAIELATHAALQSDIYEVPISQPNVINLSIEEPSMGNAFAVLGLSFDRSLGEISIPGMTGLLTLQPPVFVLGATLLDAAGSGTYSLPWAGYSNVGDTGAVISGALIPTQGPNNAEFTNHVLIEFRN